ncbi:MAG TPA: hypothetical protein VFG56_02105 [Candidatus Saccharimonadales bacterium]|nr:hypothetical protein [Candidatus Saccharimonadales bacterium]
MNPEKQPLAERGSAEIQAAAEAAAERLKNRQEKSVEQSPDTKAERVERARHETKEVFAREAGKEKRSGGEPDARTVRRATKRQKQAHYKTTMKHIQSEMPAPARTFSKVIHNRTVEKTSEAVGATVARPNAILAGSISAFIVVLTVYLITKHYGYVLSGFETIGSFVIGWTLGLIYDYARVALIRRN